VGQSVVCLRVDYLVTLTLCGHAIVTDMYTNIICHYFRIGVRQILDNEVRNAPILIVPGDTRVWIIVPIRFEVFKAMMIPCCPIMGCDTV
jgi:hypothetical protein